MNGQENEPLYGLRDAYMAALEAKKHSVHEAMVERATQELSTLSLSKGRFFISAPHNTHYFEPAKQVSKLVLWYRGSGLGVPNFEQTVSALYQEILKQDPDFEQKMEEQEFQEFAGVCLVKALKRTKERTDSYFLGKDLPSCLQREEFQAPEIIPA